MAEFTSTTVKQYTFTLEEVLRHCGITFDTGDAVFMAVQEPKRLGEQRKLVITVRGER